MIAPQISSPVPVKYDNYAKTNILAGYDTSQRKGLSLRQINLWYTLVTGDTDKRVYLQNITNKVYEYQQEMHTYGYVADPQYSAHNAIFLSSQINHPVETQQNTHIQVSFSSDIKFSSDSKSILPNNNHHFSILQVIYVVFYYLNFPCITCMKIPLVVITYVEGSDE